MRIKKDLLSINFTPKGIKEHRGIVLHSMWGSYLGSIAWFKNPKSKASAHYLISAEGEITQMVDEKDMAWHAGIIDDVAPSWTRSNPNWYTIGIELEDKRDAHWQYPESQRKATAELVKAIMGRYKLSSDHVVLHRDLNPSRRSDPVGAFSFDWVFPKEAATSPQEQMIIDVYKALLGRFPSENEKRWRLLQGKNTIELITDILENDGDAFNKWFEPKIVGVTEAFKAEILDLNKAHKQDKSKITQEWQSKLQIAKDELVLCQKKKVEEYGGKSLIGLGLRKWFDKLKNRIRGVIS